jgi:glycosyltransferase involved in cell wall biosynthesis
MAPETRQNLPAFSVIVPVWNRELQIKLCLTALMHQDYPSDLYEIIVVDNGSTDGTLAAIRSFPRVRLLQASDPGSYSARNIGIAAATGEYLAFTDSDCLPATDWLSAAAVAIKQHPEVAIYGGAIELFASERDLRVCHIYETLFHMRQETAVRTGRCITANWVSPSAVIRRVGGFNAAMKSSGDNELARRIHALKLPLLYVPTMVVRHPVRGRVAALIQKRRRHQGGVWHMMDGWYPRFCYFVRLCLRLTVIFFRALTYRDLRLADQMKLGGLMVILNVTDIAETILLALGAEERRE